MSKLIGTLIAVIQIVDIVIHAATNQLEILRVSSNVIILLWLAGAASGKFNTMSLMNSSVTYSIVAHLMVRPRSEYRSISSFLAFMGFSKYFDFRDELFIHCAILQGVQQVYQSVVDVGYFRTVVGFVDAVLLLLSKQGPVEFHK